MTVGDSEPQRSLSWIDRFLQYTEEVTAPALFKKWAAISTIAGAMERRLWITTNNGVLYPNLYVMLIGPAGTGKGNVLRPSRSLLKSVKELHVSFTSMSAASAMDALNEATRTIVQPAKVPPYLEYNSLFMHIPELMVLIPAYDMEMMGKLTDIYDCLYYEERKRTLKTKIEIKNPQFNMLSGTTTSYLNHLLPQGAWEQGFMSRTIMVFSMDRDPTNLILDDPTNIDNEETPLFQELSHELNNIANRYGKISWTREASATMIRWAHEGLMPAPDHPKLQGYNARRIAHMLKLCMIFSVARSDDFLITLNDFQNAQEILISTEYFMPDVFKAASSGGDSSAIDDIFHYMLATYTKRKMKPISQGELVTFVQSKVPAHSVMRVIEIMYKSNMIEIVGADARGNPLYKPVARQLHSGS
jgi:hypothetical protein